MKFSNKTKLPFIITVILIGIGLLTFIPIETLISTFHKDSVENIGVFHGDLFENIIGPLRVLAFGLALLIVSLVYFNGANAYAFTLLIFSFLLIGKWDCLFFPPYGDSVSGPFMEAIWLADNKFNFSALLNQPSFLSGGPKVYVFSIYPAFQGLLLNVIKHTPTFLLVNHLLTFVMGAVAVALFREICKKVFSTEVATLLSLFFLSMPVFQSQVEIINMEMMLTCFTITSLYYLTEKKMMRACLFSICAILAKGVGIIIGATVAIVGIWLFFFDLDVKRRKRVLFWSLVAGACVLLQIYASMYILNKDAHVAMVGLFQGFKELKVLPVLYLYIASLLIFIVLIVKERLAAINLRGIFRKYFIPICFFTAAFLWFGLYLQSFGQQYRYRLMLTPLTMFCIFYIFNLALKSEVVKKVILIVGITFSLICSYGLIFPEHKVSAHAALERSLEYRNDLYVQLQTAKLLEQKYSQFKIGASFTIAHMLAYPRLGFVEKDLDVMIYSFPSQLKDLPMFQGFLSINPKQTVWVDMNTKYPLMINGQINYPISQKDAVIERIDLGNRNASIFFGGYAIELKRIAIMNQLQRLRQ